MNKYFLLFFLFLSLFTNLYGQDYGKHAAEINEINYQKYQQQIKSGELSMDDLTKSLLEQGLSPAEIEKVKQNMSKQELGSDSLKLIGQVPRETKVSDYKTYQKETPESNVFGSSFFSDPSLSFEPNLRIATPASYILGPDDELVLTISGYQEANMRLQVLPEGNINIPQVGSVYVSGQTIEDASRSIKSKLIKTAYGSIANGSSQVNISLGKIRSIHVTIIGAYKSGNFTVSSLTTAFNALYLCGGPGAINTYREIELIRNNKVYKKIDIYKILTKGDLSGNVLLKENDVINFPVYKKRISVSGEVKRSGVFELIEEETIDKLLSYAGGFTENAYISSLKVKVRTDTERKIRDVPKSEFSSFNLSNGDEVYVDPIPERLVNSVKVKGAVNRPGDFEFTPGLTLSQLLKNAGGIKDEAFLERGIITRTYPDLTRESISFSLTDVLNNKKDIELSKWDEVRIAFIDDFRSKYIVSIDGEVRNPGVYEYKQNLSLKDVIFLSGGFTDAGAAYRIEVSRRIVNDEWKELNDSISKVFTIDLDKALMFTDNYFILKPFDIITVRRNPGYYEQRRVSIDGEIYFPGSYSLISEKDRISDILKRAGGLTKYANMDGMSLVRNTKSDEPISEIKKETIESVQYSIKDTNNKVIKDLKSKNVKIALDSKKILNNPGSKEDYVLENGDKILIAKKDPLVKVSGEVLMSSKTNFEKGKSLKYYLRKSGGTTENARLSKIYVVYANGDLDKRSNGFLGLFKFYPDIKSGCEIVVPKKGEKRKLSVTESIGLVSTIVSILSLSILTANSLSK